MNRGLGLLGVTALLTTSCASQPAYGPVSVLPHNAPVAAGFIVHADADVTVHNAEQWKERSLNDQPWLMVGSNGEGGAWYAYLRFPLDVLPASRAVVDATLELPRMTDIVLPEEADFLPIHVWSLLQPWDENDTTWVRQPRIESAPAVTVDLDAGSVHDEIDLTLAVQDALQRGDAYLDVLLTPAVYDVDFRVRWPSRESMMSDGEDSVDGFERVGEPSPLAGNVLRLPQVELRVEFEP